MMNTTTNNETMAATTETKVTKLTKVQKFRLVLDWLQEITMSDVQLTPEQETEITMLNEFIEREIELCSRPKSKSNKAAAEQEEFNQKVMGILEVATAPMRATEVGRALDISTSKATSILIRLVKSGKITKVAIDNKTNGYVAASTNDADSAI